MSYQTGSVNPVSTRNRAVVFILDSECGLRARPMEDARRAVAAALRRLKPHDSFAVVAFDFELLLLVVFILDSECELRARPMEDARRAVAAALRRLKPHDSFAVVAFDFELLLLGDLSLRLPRLFPLQPSLPRSPLPPPPTTPPPSTPRQVFSRAVVFILDSECGLRGRPMEDARRAVAGALKRLKPHDSFAVVAFDFELLLLDDELEAASPEAVRRACKFVLQAHDWAQPTNVLTPLQLVGGKGQLMCSRRSSWWVESGGSGWRMAFRMLRGHTAALQQVVLITDGPVRAERRVCHWVQRALADWGGTAPRISTLGIGPSVNPFFLKWLAAATRGSSQVTRNPAEVRRRLDGMLQTMARPLVTNIAIRDLPPACELYPYPIPDLYASGPVVVSGRMGDEGPAAGGAEGGGGLPLHVELRGVLASGAPWKFRSALSDAGNLPLTSVRPRPLCPSPPYACPCPLCPSPPYAHALSAPLLLKNLRSLIYLPPTANFSASAPFSLPLALLHPPAPSCTAVTAGTWHQAGAGERVAILTADAWLHGDPQLQQAVRDCALSLCKAEKAMYGDVGNVPFCHHFAASMQQALRLSHSCMCDECGSVSGIRAHTHAAARHHPASAGPAAHRSAAGAVMMGAEGWVTAPRGSWLLNGGCCWVLVGIGGWRLTGMGGGGCVG
ncbi:unnamed protein product [Closterium sp. Naga37s-1]|nr:unnamed protein product [Closterium sp. Naga37s-1]